jgi:hypothetical protein
MKHELEQVTISRLLHDTLARIGKRLQVNRKNRLAFAFGCQ